MEPGTVVPLTARSPLLADYYVRRVREVCSLLKLEPVFVDLDLLTVPGLAENGPDRCYLCKKELYGTLGRRARAMGCDSVMDGTNVDDLGEHRPGLAAAEEEGIQHPFVEAGMGEEEITALGLRLGTRAEDNPSDSCLATRIPGGTPITRGLLELVERMEAPIRPAVRGRFRARLKEGSMCISVEYEGRDREAVTRHLDRLRECALDHSVCLELRRTDGDQSSFR
ncbi:MAG: hypothetical protein R6U39_06975 [Candidatus Aegiribacteria sp.]